MRSTEPAVVMFVALAAFAAQARAQGASSIRIAIVQAEERASPTAADLAVLRRGARGADPDTARMAIRALGLLGRPVLVGDLVPVLRFELPELRAAAASAIGAALAGGGSSVAAALPTLVARLAAEEEPAVRAALADTLGQLPYGGADQIAQAARALIDLANRDSVTDRLGAARGLEALVRLNHSERTAAPAGPAWRPGEDTIATLRKLFGLPQDPAASATSLARAPSADALHDARVRRLALAGLIACGASNREVVERAAADGDSQVRRLAMTAAAAPNIPDDPAIAGALARGLHDPVAMVRIEAIRGQAARWPRSGGVCASAVELGADADPQVASAALDELGECGASPEALALLERTVDDLSYAGTPRSWHRPAHALVALSTADPKRAAARLGSFAGSALWPMRRYAARTAANLQDRATLETLVADARPEVAGEARDALARLSGQTRAPAPAPAPRRSDPPALPLTAADLRRLAAPRARIFVKGVGSFEIALFTAEAPATVLRFARLAEAGRYEGLTVDSALPNRLAAGVIRDSGAPPSTEFVRDEPGAWPHVRGAVGLSLQPSDGSDRQIFIDLVDNPSFDHTYTVFAQVLTGLDVIDRILEADEIERIEIVPGP
jgi:cyclophilin family peptidyl-prolyl cis-trans isomerase